MGAHPTEGGAQLRGPYTRAKHDLGGQAGLRLEFLTLGQDADSCPKSQQETHPATLAGRPAAILGGAGAEQGGTSPFCEH